MEKVNTTAAPLKSDDVKNFRKKLFKLELISARGILFSLDVFLLIIFTTLYRLLSASGAMHMHFSRQSNFLNAFRVS
jgi:hypothetical protein